MRILYFAFLRQRTGLGEETVEAFCRRRFGAEFSDRVMDPRVGGLYGGTPAALSMPAAFPRLVEMERRHGSITRAVLRSRLNGGFHPYRNPVVNWHSQAEVSIVFLKRNMTIQKT